MFDAHIFFRVDIMFKYTKSHCCMKVINHYNYIKEAMCTQCVIRDIGGAFPLI